MSISPEQAQFLEQRQFSVDEVARWFRVPPHMIGNLEKTSSWGTGIEQQSIGFVQFTLRPWLERIEKSWTRNMLTFNPGQRFRFDVSDLLRGDMQSMAEYSLRMHASGAMTANEIRAKFLGLPPFDGGDTHYFMVNTAPVGTEPITLQKIQTDISNEDAPVLGGDPATQQGRDLTLKLLDDRLFDLEHKPNGNGHKRSIGEGLTINVPPVEMPEIIYEPPTINVQPTPVNVRVAQPPLARKGRTRRTIEFSDGREPITVTEEPDDG